MDKLLSSSKSILILLPVNPSFDSVAAGLSLFLSLKESKKNTVISCPSDMVVEFNRLVGVDKISPQLGNKNLIIRFGEYPVENLQSVTYDIVNGEIRIKVEPKSYAEPPKKDQVDLTYAGVGADTVMLIGGSDENQFPSLITPEFKGARFVHVGIQILPLTPPREALSWSREGSSISEVVATILKENALPLDSDIATNLVMGIEIGSKNFSSDGVTAQTFEVFASLLRAGGKRAGRNASAERKNFPPGAIPGMPIPVASSKAPKSWYEPKIYKGSGTPVS